MMSINHAQVAASLLSERVGCVLGGNKFTNLLHGRRRTLCTFLGALRDVAKSACSSEGNTNHAKRDTRHATRVMRHGVEIPRKTGNVAGSNPIIRPAGRRSRGSRDLCRSMLCALSLLFSMAMPVTADAAIAYIQGTSETAGTGTAVSVTYPSAQHAGDLNVVLIAWLDSTSSVQSVTDSSGNTYVAAGGPTRDSGVAAQQIYYAKNITSAAAKTNTVTVTFGEAVSDSDIRIAEYSGIDPVNAYDGGVGASGTGMAQNSGPLTTTNANDLLVAANFIAGVTTAAGSGFTERLINNYGEIVEDRVVTAIGTYSATATQDSSGYWLMQMAAFREAMNHTSVDMVVEEALAPFSSWVNVKTTYGATGNGTTDDTAAIQSCLNYVNGPTTTQEVCYLPAGTYKITATLTNMAGPTGVAASLIGADPATTKIRWAGSASCSNTPGLTPTSIGCAMLIQNGGHGADYERLTWDGAGIAQYGVAEWYNHANQMTTGDSAQHQDEVFQNLAIGIQPGRMDANCTDYCWLDSEGQVRRVSFINDTYAGLDTGSFNAVDWWVWDSSFSNNARGVSNDYEVPGGYVGTNGEGAGTAHVYRSNFSNSSVADIEVGHTSNWLGVHNNFSTGSAAFLYADYSGENDVAVVAEDNRVVNSSATPITFGNAGPLMLVDNQIGNTTTGPVYVLNPAFTPVPPDGDYLTLGNTAYGTWPSAAAPGTMQRIKSVNDSSNVATGSISTTAPTLPATPVVVSHTVFEVQPTDSTATIQRYINSAIASSDPQAIVHFGGRHTYNISSTLTIPAQSHVQLVGDGWMTLLAWTGTGAGPIVSIAGPSKVTIRELQFHGAQGSSNTVPIAIMGADSIGGRIQIVGSWLIGVSATNLPNTQLSLQANSDIAPLSLLTDAPAITLANVSSAISIGSFQGSLVMSGSSNYIMEDTWFEGVGTSSSAFNVPNGQFTYVGGNMAVTHGGTQTVPLVLANSGSASQTYIGMVFNLTNVNDLSYENGTNLIAADVENESTSTRAYFYGNVTCCSGWDAWFGRPGPDNGEVSFVSNRQSIGSNTGGQYANQGDTSNAGILKGWAQARALTWDTAPYTPPVGATDIRIYRVLGTYDLAGVTITN
jgi:Pectate lyase superfamily protein